MGTLFIVSTPIGNLEDITIRALRVLGRVVVICAEDTRRTALLISELQKRYASYFPHVDDKPPTYIRVDEFTEMKRAPEIIAKLESGVDVALVSDAGTPLLSDPGYLIVMHCRKRGIPVVVIPGASSVLTALVGSGMPTLPFEFNGFFPEKTNSRSDFFFSLKQQSIAFPKNPVTHVFFVSPHDFHTMLTLFGSVFGDQELCVCRELTKVHEEYWRGTAADALTYFVEPKGEFVIVFRL
jgi:16S rRNA (cytidine1402-2'-O)-methyltransferase